MHDIDSFVRDARDGDELYLASDDQLPGAAFQFTPATFGATVPEVAANQDMLRSAGAEPESILCLEHAQAFGRGFGQQRDGEFYHRQPYSPNYMARLFAKPAVQDLVDQHRRNAVRQQNFDAVYCPIHHHCHMYGHFLTEQLPGLFTIRKMYAAGHRFPIFIGNFAHWPFVETIVRMILPDAELLTGLDMVSARRIFVPRSYGQRIYPARLARAISDFAGSFSRPDLGEGRQIYLTRTGVEARSTRQMSNAAEVEAVAAARGFELIAPEKLSFADQIALFQSARVIVGEYGSALHNAMFSKVGASVVALNWMNQRQQALGLAFGHRNIFVFPEGGYAHVPRFLPSGHSRDFAVNPDLVDAALDYAQTPVNSDHIFGPASTESAMHTVHRGVSSSLS